MEVEVGNYHQTQVFPDLVYSLMEDQADPVVGEDFLTEQVAALQVQSVLVVDGLQIHHSHLIQTRELPEEAEQLVVAKVVQMAVQGAVVYLGVVYTTWVEVEVEKIVVRILEGGQEVLVEEGLLQLIPPLPQLQVLLDKMDLLQQVAAGPGAQEVATRQDQVLLVL